MSTNEKKTYTGSIIMFALAVVFIGGSVLLHFIKNGVFGCTVSDIVAGVACAIAGVIMLKKSIKGYGWLVGVIVGLAGLASSASEGDVRLIAVSGVILVVCAAFLIRANIVKKNS